jgi:hypothetical protein
MIELGSYLSGYHAGLSGQPEQPPWGVVVRDWRQGWRHGRRACLRKGSVATA